MPIDQTLLIPTLKGTAGLPSETIADIVALAAGGASALGELSDVTLTSPSADQIFSFDGLVWRNNAAINANPDSLVTLFHNINAGAGFSLSADSLGANIRDHVGSAPNDLLLRFIEGSFTVLLQAQLGFVASDDFTIENALAGGDILLKTNAGNVSVVGALFDLVPATNIASRFRTWNTTGGGVALSAVPTTGDSVLQQLDATGAVTANFITMAQSGAVEINFNGLLEATSKSGGFRIVAELEIDGAFNHDGLTYGVYGTTPIVLQTGVAVTAAGVHAALVNLGFITA